MSIWEELDKLEVKISAEDKQELIMHMEAVNNILAKYPYFKDPKSHFTTTMSRSKTAAKECRDWVRRLDVEKNAGEEVV